MEMFKYVVSTLIDDISNIGNDPVLGTLSLIMAILLLCAIALTAGLIFSIIDSAFRKKFVTTGYVIDRGYTPAHNTIIMQKVGEVFVPQTIHHPDRWSFLVELGGAVDNEKAQVDVTEKQFNTIVPMAKVSVRGVTGRISGKTYLTEVIGD